MAKGQRRTGREAKKPKADKRLVESSGAVSGAFGGPSPAAAEKRK